MSAATAADGKIECLIDGARVHAVSMHIKEHHSPEWTIERYKTEFPGAPLYSDTAVAAAKRRRAEEAAVVKTEDKSIELRAFHEVFEFGKVAAAMSSKGEPIMLDFFVDLPDAARVFVPEIDPRWVMDIELAKTIILGLKLNLPQYIWGMHGTGKTTLLEQAHARTQRPLLRVQHTINTEEAEIVGHYVVRGGETIFELGPLPQAMIGGYTYLADEYDFAMPAITAVYQPVLEGKALVIKGAPPELRVIKPHPNFRFCATGNTNGVGDETGMYQGTQLGNAANYSRFGVTEEVGYMDAKVESLIVANQAGIKREHAAKLVSVANEIRKAYKAGTVSCTISPRELINAATLGKARAGNWRHGFRQAFLNRQSRVDRETIDQFCQREFG